MRKGIYISSFYQSIVQFISILRRVFKGESNLDCINDIRTILSYLSSFICHFRCTQAELADMYTNCMKLSAENKISVKNAFQLKLIDYMAEMMKTKKKSEMDNFQSASCALDASTKIYAYRVDSVHSDTLKLAGGVGDTNKENEGNKNNTEGKKQKTVLNRLL